jgi:adenosylhomocysteinase
MPRTRIATTAAAEISRINAFFPIMPLLGNHWATSRPFEGMSIGISAHLTTLTATLVRELSLGGGSWAICGASDATTDQGVVQLLRDTGVSVYTTGSHHDYHQEVLDHQPDLLADVGADLIGTLVRSRPDQAAGLRGAVEVTKSGINRIRQLDLPFPTININDGKLKPAIENRHGVGEGLWHSVQALTGMHLSGRRVGVIGYGPVGKGVAAYARAAGANVEIVETHPIRRLIAHYDGFPAPPLEDCLSRVGIVVTATGKSRVLSAAILQQARRDFVLLNAGHGGDEIEVSDIKARAEAVDQVADLVVRYSLPGGTTVTLLADGHPLNIVTNAGSPEPVLLHFAVLGLSLEWLCTNELPIGEQPIPQGIERRAAELAIQALGHERR